MENSQSTSQQLEHLWNQSKYKSTGLVLHDEEKILDFNRQFEEITGYSGPELRQMSFFQLFSPAHEKKVKEHIASSRHIPEEVRGLRKYGQKYPLHIESGITQYQGKAVSITRFRDLNLLQKEEEQTLFSQTYYGTLFEQAADAVFVHDDEGRILGVNNSACQSLGFSRQELLKMVVTDFEVDFDLAAVQQEWEKMKPGKSYKLLGHHKRKNGSFFPVEVNLGCSFWKGKKIFLAFAQDISQRVTSQEKLRQSEEKFRMIVQEFPDPIFIQSLTRFTFLNPAACKLFGVKSQEELSGSPVRNFIHPDNREAFDQMSRQVETSHEPGRNELPLHRVLSMAGSHRWVETHGVPIEYEGVKGGLYFMRDITDRVEAERELGELRAILHAAISSMTDAVMICDNQGRLLHMNNAFASFHGFRNLKDCIQNFDRFDELLEARWPDGQILSPEQWAIPRALKGESRTNEEFTIRRRDSGQEWEASYSFSPIHDQQGDIVGMVLVGRDITQAKRAEKELREARALLETATNAMTDALFISDTEGNLLHMNNTFASFHRFNSLDECPRHLSGYTAILEVLRPDGKPTTVEDWAIPRALKGEKSEYEEYLFKRKDTGDTWYASYSFSPLHDEQGNISGAVVVARDITRVKEQQKLLRLVIDNLPVGVIIANKEGVIVDSNPQADTIWGGALHVHMDKFREYKGWWADSGKRLDSADWAMARALQHGQTSIREEINIETFDGKHKTILNSALPIMDSSNSITGALVVIEDITFRKNAEKVLKQAEIDRASAKFKQDFLANMSHEIRTPLTGVMGMIGMLQQTNPSQQQKEYINILKSSGENLREIINQILDLSKIEAGKVSLNYTRFEFASLLQNARKLFQGLHKKNVRFALDLHPDIPRFIEADMRRISQVLNNLVLNAIKYTHKGEIRIISQLKEIHEDKKSLLIKIMVTDTGIGIEPQKQQNIFDPFYQAEETGDFNITGTGLGLAISKELVKLHGGEIGVYSKPGQCSNFWFTFRARIPDPTAGILPRQKTQSPATKSLRILLVEDNRVNQKVFQIILGFLGHTIAFADNGQHALEIYKPGQYDLILMDISMPVMDGITATKKLRDKYRKLPPIVGLSANAAEGDREKYLQQGLDEYLTKPLVEEEFNLMVNQLLGEEE